MKTEPHDYIEMMTIREQFAMAAMQGLLANSEFTAHFSYTGNHCEELSIKSVAHADALIEALNKEVPVEQK